MRYSRFVGTRSYYLWLRDALAVGSAHCMNGNYDYVNLLIIIYSNADNWACFTQTQIIKCSDSDTAPVRHSCFVYQLAHDNDTG